MGDPKKQRKRFSKPLKKWDKERIEEERVLIKEYALKNKKELWKFSSILRDFKERAKMLVKETPANFELRKQLINKLYTLGLVDADAKIDDVLGLELKSLLDRRLQTVVFKKGFALSCKQARQFITHGLIMVGDKKIKSPSYIVKRVEEELIKINPKSRLSSPEHPELSKILQKAAKEKEGVKEENAPKQMEKKRKSSNKNRDKARKRSSKKINEKKSGDKKSIKNNNERVENE
ncbi:MAG: 30S ribosomal protein S4 [Candidatus Woesearchaeota archaeon]